MRYRFAFDRTAHRLYFDRVGRYYDRFGRLSRLGRRMLPRPARSHGTRRVRSRLTDEAEQRTPVRLEIELGPEVGA